ncbi:unnamed protein product, partial [Vitis vinifera]|uniref:Uncharacterized protein n=1 Tax=Vitis vinifera TaxID=29760 RepID=D7TNW3_VITVI
MKRGGYPDCCLYSNKDQHRRLTMRTMFDMTMEKNMSQH